MSNQEPAERYVARSWDMTCDALIGQAYSGLYRCDKRPAAYREDGNAHFCAAHAHIKALPLPPQTWVSHPHSPGARYFLDGEPAPPHNPVADACFKFNLVTREEARRMVDAERDAATGYRVELAQARERIKALEARTSTKRITDFFKDRSFARYSDAIDTKVNQDGRLEATETIRYREIVFPAWTNITDQRHDWFGGLEPGVLKRLDPHLFAPDGTPIPAVPKTPADAPVTFTSKGVADTVTLSPPTGVTLVKPEAASDGTASVTLALDKPTLKRPCTICNLVEARYFPVYSGALCHACARAKMPPLEAVPRRWPKIVAAVVGAAAAVGGAVAAWGVYAGS